MKPEEMNMAIAKHIGWTAIEDRSAGLMMPNGFSVFGYPPQGALIGKKVPIPRYSSDLNAMREARSALETATQKTNFVVHLHRIVAPDPLRKDHPWDLIDAKPEQQAEAFLRTIGKWMHA